MPDPTRPPPAPAPPTGSPSDSVQLLFSQCVGKGGFGEVYLARMTTSGGLSREVAVKLLLASIDPGSVLRLRDEARLLAALNHRAIVQVYDLVAVEGRPALITEYIDGTDLSGVITESGALPVKVALEVVGDVAGALNAALTTPSPTTRAPLRLVHRDIKPGNIRIARSGAVKLLDFGIAVSGAIDREAKTGTGLIIGTLGYLAPERLGEPGVHPASDVYALGCVLYEALYGERLYAGVSQTQTFRLALNEDDYARFLAARLAALPPELPPAVRSLLASSLAYEAHQRPDAAAFEHACDELATQLAGVGLRGWVRTRAWTAPAPERGSLEGRTIDVSASTPAPLPPATRPASFEEPPLTVGAPHPLTAPRAAPPVAAPVAPPAGAAPSTGAAPRRRSAVPAVLLVTLLGFLTLGGAAALGLVGWLATRGDSASTDTLDTDPLTPAPEGAPTLPDGADVTGTTEATGATGVTDAAEPSSVTTPPPERSAPAAAPGSTPASLASGLTVDVPAGWQSNAVDATRMLMMGPDGTTMIIASVADAQGGDLRTELSGSIDVGDGLVFVPSGTPHEDAGGLTNDFDVVGGTVAVKGIAFGRMLGDGRVLAVLGIAPAAGIEAVRREQRQVFRTARVGRARTADAAAGSWAAYLQGRYLVKLYTGNGYSEKHELWLCSNGNYARLTDGGGFGMDGTSAAFSGGTEGAWTATGGTSGVGTLSLVATDGTRAQLGVEMGSDGVYLNGERWMRGDNTRCR